jgi:hypothetical protein
MGIPSRAVEAIKIEAVRRLNRFMAIRKLKGTA